MKDSIDLSAIKRTLNEITSQQSKDTVDKMKLNYSIIQVEEDITKLFVKIGTLSYSAHKNNTLITTELESCYKKLDLLHKRLENLNDRLNC